MPTSSACGFCASCMLGRISECEKRHLTIQDGYFAEAVAVDRRNVWKIPDISPEAAVLLEPMGMAFDVIRLAEVDLGTTLAVVGSGPIGLMTIRIAKIRGAQRVFVIGVTPDMDREKLCVELGADVFINADAAEPISAIMDLTAGRGVDSVVNTATVQSLPGSLAMCAYGGRVVFMGEETIGVEQARPVIGLDSAGAVPIDVNWMHLNRLELRGSFAVPNGLLPLGSSLLEAGIFPVAKMVTHIFPLATSSRLCVWSPTMRMGSSKRRSELVNSEYMRPRLRLAAFTELPRVPPSIPKSRAVCAIGTALLPARQPLVRPGGSE